MPDVIFWSQDIGRYAPMPDDVMQYERLNEQWAQEHNDRLDTFTRCQETIDVYVSLVSELIDELECMTAAFYAPSSDEILNRAKQIMEQNK